MNNNVARDNMIKVGLDVLGFSVGLGPLLIVLYDAFLYSLGKILRNLQDLRQLLIRLSQRYAEIRGYHGELNERVKNEFLGMMKTAEDELRTGFDILKRFQEKDT